MAIPEDPNGLLPNSELCNAAIEYARVVSEPYLFHHVMRSAHHAELLGRQRRVEYDREVLCVASVLHDLAAEPGGAA